MDLESLLDTLARGGVRFIVVGGVAAFIHGSARPLHGKVNAGGARP